MFTRILALSCVAGAAYAYIHVMPSRFRAPIALNAMPEAETEKVFYALGINVARQVGPELKSVLSPEEIRLVSIGFSDAMNNQVVGDEMGVLQKYGPQLNDMIQERASKALKSEKQTGEAFASSYLLKNPKAIRTASGLIYNPILNGTGKQVDPSGTAEVHYHGTLVDGTVFDSSVARGETVKFPLNGVIKGWQEGVAMMREGGKATLVCPSDLAYGDSGSPPLIAPGSTLVFEVELIGVH
jgi:FKBP-type peptidyl-prolyl cis-trans isomerase FkpA